MREQIESIDFLLKHKNKEIDSLRQQLAEKDRIIEEQAGSIEALQRQATVMRETHSDNIRRIEQQQQAIIDKAKAEERERIAAMIHYPECWDTMAYHTLEDALREIGCRECAIKDG